jgi:hypothetical protein
MIEAGAVTSSGRASPRPSVERTTLASAVVGTQREPHWNVTLLVPSEFVTMLDVIGCEPYFRQ